MCIMPITLGFKHKASWRRVSGLFRKTSRTFERCFAALGFIIVMLVLAALYDLIQGRGQELLASVSLALVIPGENSLTRDACVSPLHGHARVAYCI